MSEESEALKEESLESVSKAVDVAKFEVDITREDLNALILHAQNSVRKIAYATIAEIESLLGDTMNEVHETNETSKAREKTVNKIDQMHMTVIGMASNMTQLVDNATKDIKLREAELDIRRADTESHKKVAEALTMVAENQKELLQQKKSSDEARDQAVGQTVEVATKQDVVPMTVFNRFALIVLGCLAAVVGTVLVSVVVGILWYTGTQARVKDGERLLELGQKAGVAEQKAVQAEKKTDELEKKVENLSEFHSK